MIVSNKELLLNGTDVAFQQFLEDLTIFGTIMRANNTRLAKQIGLTLQQFTILVMLARHQGKEGHGVNKIADMLHISGAYVTIEVGKLVALGFIHKALHQTDARRIVLSLTHRAISALDGLDSLMVSTNDTSFESLSTETFETLRQVVPQMIKSAKRSVSVIDLIIGSDR